MAWLYVPGAEASKRDCTSSFQNIEPYVLLNGRPTPQPLSWNGWKRRGWARVLCGMTLPPSILCRGVDSWISSLRDTRASRSVTPEKVFARMTRAICGLTSSGISAHLCRQSSGWKTSQLTLPGVSVPSETIWNELVTELQRESLARKKSARHIFENASLFSACWPTVTVHGNHNRKGISEKENKMRLRGQLEDLNHGANWGTPTARDYKAGRGMKGQLTTHLQSGPGLLEEEPNNTCGKSPGLLNPAWVEQLMGWVPGMSSFSCSETEWCRWLRQWRLWLFGRN